MAGGQVGDGLASADQNSVPTCMGGWRCGWKPSRGGHPPPDLQGPGQPLRGVLPTLGVTAVRAGGSSEVLTLLPWAGGAVFCSERDRVSPSRFCKWTCHGAHWGPQLVALGGGIAAGPGATCHQGQPVGSLAEDLGMCFVLWARPLRALVPCSSSARTDLVLVSAAQAGPRPGAPARV